jgi:hypothetical protein
MAPATTPPPPGSMTVPPLFGWEGILTVVAILLIVAVGYLVILASRTSKDSRSEWQAFLDARSSRPATDLGSPGAAQPGSDSCPAGTARVSPR